MITSRSPYGKVFIVLPIALVLLFTACQETPSPETPDIMDLSHLFENEDLQAFGMRLFFDENLSTPPGQSCATCHGPEAGWTGPIEEVNLAGGVYPGAVHERFGNRKPNSAAYATPSPLFHAIREGDEVLFVGGNFWDGRATGHVLGNAAADQAMGPFLNPVEQNNASAAVVVEKVCQSDYAEMFAEIAAELWGIDDICAHDDTDMAYGIICIAIAAFESSDGVNQFSSKYDYYLKGEATLTPEEELGLELFEGKGMCADCHPSRPGPDGEPPLFTDFTYDNLGVPRNPKNPWYEMGPEFNPDGEDWIDPGLGGFLETSPRYAMFADGSYGKHRVPTLRNVDMRPDPDFVKVFGHNGYFESLEQFMRFYNTRDVLPCSDGVDDPEPGVNCWPPPEDPRNLNTTELGSLGLTPEEEAAIIAFMRTLTDGYEPPAGEE